MGTARELAAVGEPAEELGLGSAALATQLGLRSVECWLMYRWPLWADCLLLVGSLAFNLLCRSDETFSVTCRPEICLFLFLFFVPSGCLWLRTHISINR